MQLLTHFLELRAGFEHGVEHEPQPITLEELAERLYCSTRNVKILLKKMSDQNWISWKPGRGRGNISELTFLGLFGGYDFETSDGAWRVEVIIKVRLN